MSVSIFSCVTGKDLLVSWIPRCPRQTILRSVKPDGVSTRKSWALIRSSRCTTTKDVRAPEEEGCLGTKKIKYPTNPTGPGYTTDQHCIHAVKCQYIYKNVSSRGVHMKPC